ncbi:hypothetical protein [Sphingomonas baiyangensis]|uniref:Uncharacterized protein n=1 Tax=Sphingomonas baiyangensis TaxID=2572576 RepID=A0A4U1L7I3_9SPHN|nr:hypothetical protein [Sphingomonas baiyangensis]TKD52912.1 hypothetical protein FBR43_00735 [Sphingomonas baiyangensis]
MKIARHGVDRTTRLLLIAAICVGLAHHVDHVLRVDHSGWPFTPRVTPFTFSLAAYPVLLFALLGPARLFWWRWALMVAGTAFTLFAHVRIETPRMQYAMWAFNRSLEPHLAGVRNLCGIESGALGWLSMGVSMALNVLLVTTVIVMLANRPAGARP